MIELVNTSFYNKLIGGTSLQTKLSGGASDKKIYNTVAPQGSSFPYLTFGLLTDVPSGIFGELHEFEDLTFYVNCFTTTSPADCFQIADLVKTLMDDCALTGITGYDHLYCKREYVSNLL